MLALGLASPAASPRAAGAAPEPWSDGGEGEHLRPLDSVVALDHEPEPEPEAKPEEAALAPGAPWRSPGTPATWIDAAVATRAAERLHACPLLPTDFDGPSGDDPLAMELLPVPPLHVPAPPPPPSLTLSNLMAHVLASSLAPAAGCETPSGGGDGGARRTPSAVNPAASASDGSSSSDEEEKEFKSRHRARTARVLPVRRPPARPPPARAGHPVASLPGRGTVAAGRAAAAAAAAAARAAAAAAAAADAAPEGAPITVAWLEARGLFDVPIKAAAAAAGCSQTALKRVCRGAGISRWPYRQRLSVKNLLARGEAIFGDDDDAVAALRDAEARLRANPGAVLEGRMKAARQAMFKLAFNRGRGADGDAEGLAKEVAAAFRG